ncbi:AraC family transcriptional regulator [Clostridium lacusfryxellense]|uniref:AraC family transcriptional regulator n=1 Tax=Clostridium lacusfryxellense TaxID=205328 RepID=UPI001C0C227D|nr:AraC family transcriptional regulator [Clostridium lacusfryxellense]MBU3113279.1 AraC family transcriptional regulator [Clostridium lacusfryxellense]
MLDFFINEIDKNINYQHIQTKKPYVDFHLHEGCEIYFLISGDVNYFVENTIFPIKFGDLIITNNNEVHKPAFNSAVIYERITIEFDYNLAKAFNYSDYDLLSCFFNREKGQQNKISLTEKEISDLLDLFHRYEYLKQTTTNGINILKLNCFIELLVYINVLFTKTKVTANPMCIHKKLIPILDYIDKNLCEDLSLEVLEKNFFISRFYLSKLFKKHTGSTLHEYIIYKRIALSKKLLINGCTVTEACNQSGFNDYSNFLKIFKKTVGILPGRYSKL